MTQKNLFKSNRKVPNGSKGNGKVTFSHTCSSIGNQVTSEEHDIFHVTGAFQITCPLDLTTTFVLYMSVCARLVSNALYTKRIDQIEEMIQLMTSLTSF